jgi:hypothetical protein
MVPRAVKDGRWCRKCVDKQRSIQDRTLEIIEQKKGQLLTPDFIYKTRIRVRCQHGHSFETYPRHLANDRWCPECRVVEEKVINQGGEIFTQNEGIYQVFCQKHHLFTKQVRN